MSLPVKKRKHPCDYTNITGENSTAVKNDNSGDIKQYSSDKFTKCKNYKDNATTFDMISKKSTFNCTDSVNDNEIVTDTSSSTKIQDISNNVNDDDVNVVSITDDNRNNKETDDDNMMDANAQCHAKYNLREHPKKIGFSTEYFLDTPKTEDEIDGFRPTPISKAKKEIFENENETPININSIILTQTTADYNSVSKQNLIIPSAYQSQSQSDCTDDFLGVENDMIDLSDNLKDEYRKLENNITTTLKSEKNMGRKYRKTMILRNKLKNYFELAQSHPGLSDEEKKETVSENFNFNLLETRLRRDKHDKVYPLEKQKSAKNRNISIEDKGRDIIDCVSKLGTTKNVELVKRDQLAKYIEMDREIITAGNLDNLTENIKCMGLLSPPILAVNQKKWQSIHTRWESSDGGFQKIEYRVGSCFNRI